MRHDDDDDDCPNECNVTCNAGELCVCEQFVPTVSLCVCVCVYVCVSVYLSV